MFRNQIQFQKGYSLTEFVAEYGTEPKHSTESRAPTRPGLASPAGQAAAKPRMPIRPRPDQAVVRIPRAEEPDKGRAGWTQELPEPRLADPGLRLGPGPGPRP